MCRGNAEVAGHLLGVWERDPEDPPSAGASFQRQLILCTRPQACAGALYGIPVSQGRSAQGVSSAAQHNLKTKQPKQGVPKERALPLQCPQGERCPLQPREAGPVWTLCSSPCPDFTL